MKLTAEILSETKMKVTLFNSDLCRFNITINGLLQNQEQAQGVLQQIIYNTKWSNGFFNNSPSLLIEMLIYRNYCVIFFTRVKVGALRMKKLRPNVILKFEDVRNMLCCFDKLYNHPCMNISSALYFYKNQYFLAITLNSQSNKKILEILKEFASDKCCQNSRFYDEHGILLCKNHSLSTINDLFVKHK